MEKMDEDIKNKIKTDGYYIKEGKAQIKKTKSKGEWSNFRLAWGLGFNLVLPILAGVFLGRYFDNKFSTDGIYTLSLVIAGLLFSLYNIYRIYKEVA